MKLVHHCSDGFAEWAAQRLFGCGKEFFGQCVAIGVVDGERIYAAMVYNNYKVKPDGTPLSIELSVVSIDKRWMKRHIIREMFSYPFTQLGLRRMQATTSIQDEGTNSIMQRLGFTLEGTHRAAHPFGDAYSWGMLAEDCRWLGGSHV